MLAKAATFYLSLASVFFAFPARAYYPQPIYPGDTKLSSAPYTSAGYISTKVGRGRYSGSGAVASDSRIIYSCAHLFYDAGQWATDVSFARGYSGRNKPSKKNSVSVRGYHVLAGYSPNYYDSDFPDDFAVAYGRFSFGNPLPVFSAADAVSALTGTDDKLKLGYPAELDYDLRPGFHYLHETGPFRNSFYQYSGAYYEVDDISTGVGNSGGPVLVASGGSYSLAGILVSGNNYGEPEFIGVYALSSVSEQAVNLAVDYVQNGAPETAGLRRPVLMRDGSAKYAKTQLRFKGVAPFIARASMALDVYAQPGEVDLSLRSPGGRVHVLVDSQDSNTWSNAQSGAIDISETFAASSDANGTWTLSYRDRFSGFPAYLYEAVLTLYTK